MDFTIGARIRYHRLRLGLTQRELAHRLNLPYQSIGQWECGLRQPKTKSLLRIAKALEVPLSELLEIPLEQEAQLAHIAGYVADQTGADPQQVLERQLDDRLSWPARLAQTMDRAAASALDELDEEVLEDELNRTLSRLNRRGRLEALLRLLELADNPRFNAPDGGTEHG